MPLTPLPSTLDATLAPALAQRRLQQRYRHRRTLQSPQAPLIQVDGQTYLNFCSNDYLGLANHPKVIEAFVQAASKFGVGSGASHLVAGHSHEHHALEEELAAFTGRPRALLFSSGYMANLGAITALVGRGDAIFEDRLNHASLLDAGLLSGARFQRFAHNDLANLTTRLSVSAAPRKLIVVDGVFSMDGDSAPLAALASLAEQYNAWLMVDDAHGFGCLGSTGAGSAQAAGLSLQQLPILMATLGKALGSAGAFIAGSEVLIETLIQFARTYIYTTALPPAVAAASRASLQLVISEPARRAHLHQLIQHFCRSAAALGLPLMPSATAIQPLCLGSSQRASAMSHALAQRGFWVSAIRPPTVPEGSARLRITLSAAHSLAQVDSLLTALAETLPEQTP